VFVAAGGRAEEEGAAEGDGAQKTLLPLLPPAPLPLGPLLEAPAAGVFARAAPPARHELDGRASAECVLFFFPRAASILFYFACRTPAPPFFTGFYRARARHKKPVPPNPHTHTPTTPTPKKRAAGAWGCCT
jgi:hypothetical protein